MVERTMVAYASGAVQVVHIHSYLHFFFRMLPSVVSCRSIVFLRCSGGFFFSSWDIMSISVMTRSAGVTSGLVMYLFFWDTMPENRVVYVYFIHMIQSR